MAVTLMVTVLSLSRLAVELLEMATSNTQAHIDFPGKCPHDLLRVLRSLRCNHDVYPVLNKAHKRGHGVNFFDQIPVKKFTAKVCMRTPCSARGTSCPGKKVNMASKKKKS